MDNDVILRPGVVLTTVELARYLKIKPATLEKARSTGLGNYPEHKKIGRLVRYFAEDIIEWLKSGRRK